MPTTLRTDGRVDYRLRLLDRDTIGVGREPCAVEVPMSALVGRRIRLRYLGHQVCIRCGRTVTKHYGDGLCFPCFDTAPEASPCVVRPELCEAHLGRGRDPQWEQRHHNRPHLVYLAISSAAKIGVTRLDNTPTRWIDQGASQAIVVAKTPYRRAAGIIEVALKSRYTDRTAWRKMLTLTEPPPINIVEERRQILEVLKNDAPDYVQYLSEETRGVEHISYPISQTPTKVTSASLARVGELDRVLVGIKGQYLLFEGSTVLNIRRHAGVALEMTVM